MPERDYSATLLSKKLGAKPGVNVVVLFTTSAFVYRLSDR
jgi:hypothetical protein